MSQEKRTISELTIGSRLLYRSKEDWRTAAVSRIGDDYATLTVCSPKGRTYRLRRKITAEIRLEGSLPILLAEAYPDEYWKDNFGRYDRRW